MLGIGRRALLISLPLLAAGIAPACAAAQECRVATLAGNPEWAPFTVAGADGKLGGAGAIVAAAQPMAVNPVHMMLSRRSPCAGRIEALNRALAALRADGTIDRLIAAAESS